MNINGSQQPVAFLFAGQGNPLIGMGADLWDINPMTRQIWDCACDISGRDIRQLCLKGPMNRLIHTTIQQLAVTAINVTLFSLYRERFENLRVAAACGHSVGEYSALYAAGAISLEALFRLIHFRANLMNDLSRRYPGSMLVVNGIDYVGLHTLIDHSGVTLDICCDNSHKQQLVGGTMQALAEFTHVLISAGYSPAKCGVSGAWHTRLMQEGCAAMRDFLRGVDIFTPQCDVLMNVTGAAVKEVQFIKENLALHLTHTVRWTDSMEHLLTGSSPVRFLEMSHKPYLCQLLKDYSAFSPQNAVHSRTILSMLGGQP
ncbi:ACP S-malonyltransferase [Vagococcus sp. WN89Y]|uniref:ACP S-malonyltransferase n=1 Tax=Vagococcus sp. WN89Y TaxID=3457258 RepID=UPI003FCDC1A7